MSKPDELANPLTAVYEQALDMYRDLEASVLADYGLPLTVKLPGAHTREALYGWPEDPETVTPEELAYLEQTRGQDAVGRWLAEHYMKQAEAAQLDPEHAQYARTE